MHCIFNDNKQVVFWWNPKCGCSFIKKLFKYLLNEEIKYHHAIDYELHINTYNNYSKHTEDFSHFLFIRNPYHRIVTTFIQIYIKQWGYSIERLSRDINTSNLDNLTFTKFVNILLKNKYKNRNDWYIYNHFKPQTIYYDYEFNFSKIFDLYNIDYDYLTDFFNKDISLSDINHLRETGIDHVNVQNTNFQHYVYHYSIDTFIDFKIIPEYKYFFNDELKRKVYELYKDDFIFFESNDFFFDI